MFAALFFVCFFASSSNQCFVGTLTCSYKGTKIKQSQSGRANIWLGVQPLTRQRYRLLLSVLCDITKGRFGQIFVKRRTHKIGDLKVLQSCGHLYAQFCSEFCFGCGVRWPEVSARGILERFRVDVCVHTISL